MQFVYGIDQSFSQTGVARIAKLEDGALVARARSMPKWVSVQNPYSARHAAIKLHAYNITRTINDDAKLVVIEGPSYMSKGQSLWQLASLLDHVYGSLRERNIPVAVCPPTVRAKWATGKGNAKKELVCIHVDRMWPDVGTNNDELDALALACVGAQWLGWPVPARAHHRACLNSVEWPNKESLRSSETQDLLASGVLTL